MSNLNKVMLIGRVGDEVELKHTPSGSAVANFSLATTEKWNKDGQKKEKTEWSRVVVWGKLAELCNQYVHKGSLIYVEGKLETRSWDDKNGVKRYTTEIKANAIQFLSTQKPMDDTLVKAEPAEAYDVKVDAQYASNDVPF